MYPAYFFFTGTTMPFCSLCAALMIVHTIQYYTDRKRNMQIQSLPQGFIIMTADAFEGGTGQPH